MLQTAIITLPSRIIAVVVLASLASGPSQDSAKVEPHPATGVVTGRARTISNTPLPNARVRLREGRLGHVAAQTRTNGLGDFTFDGVERGLYVAELLTEGDRVVAAGEMFSIEAGETAATTITLSRIGSGMLAGEITGHVATAGDTITTSTGIATWLSAATAAGVLLLQPVGPPVSGEK